MWWVVGGEEIAMDVISKEPSNYLQQQEIFSNNVILICTKKVKQINTIAYDKLFNTRYVCAGSGAVRKLAVEAQSNMLTVAPPSTPH